MSHKKILIAVLGLCVFVVAAVAGYHGPDWLQDYRIYSAQRNYKAPAVPAKIAGEFAATMQSLKAASEPLPLPDTVFTGPGGKSVLFSEFRGKPLLVNLWATWCPPCIVELPSLERLQRHYEGKLQVIAVSVESGKEQTVIQNFLEKRGIGDFAGYANTDATIAGKLNILGLPTSFLVGSDGLILYRFEGEVDWTSPESLAFFDVFLLQNR